MANYATLKAAVQAVVKSNGAQEITGANLQSALLNIINTIGANYTFAGVATPETNAGTPDQNVVYIGGAGTYGNFGSSYTVAECSIGVFKYNGSWTKSSISIVDETMRDNMNAIVEGGTYSKVVEKENAYSSTYISRYSNDHIFVNKSGTSAFTISQYYIGQGNTFSVEIPKTGNQYGYIWGYSESLIASAPSAETGYSGTCISSATGTAAAYSFTATNNSGYDYLVVAYDATGGEPIVKKDMSVNGIRNDEEDISSLEIFQTNAQTQLNTLINGGTLTKVITKENTLAPCYISRFSDTNIFVNKSGTSAFTISQYNIGQCDFSVSIPKTGNQYGYIWVVTKELIPSAPNAETSYLGNCISAVKGTLAAYSFSATNNTGYDYLTIAYDSSAGEPTVIKTMTMNGVLEDERNIELAMDIKDNGITKSIGSMSDTEYITLNEYPSSNSIGDCYSFRCNITTFDKVKIGRGGYGNTVDGGNFSQYMNNWLVIDDTNIYVYSHVSSDTLNETIAHGLTIQSFLSVNMCLEEDSKMHIKLVTEQGHFIVETSAWNVDANGFVKVISDGSTLTSCTLSATNRHFKDALWVFGASYEMHPYWQQYVRALGYTNYLSNAYAGRTSPICFADFLRALNYGTPKYVYWTMYGNDSPTTLDGYIGTMLQLCQSYGITLIIINRPNATDQGVQDNYAAKKAVIDAYIAQGVRYVNSALALSSNPASPNGWYPGYLNSDGKHPQGMALQSLAMQVIVDIPEIMD